VRPVLVLDDPDLAEPPARPDPRDHRDRGHFLTPRLYPKAPCDPWETRQPADVDKDSM
jgi:hypothetical protein